MNSTKGSTKEFLCKNRALDELATLWIKLWNRKPCFLISDENTYPLCGSRVREDIAAQGISLAAEYRFPGSPVLHADYHYVEKLVKELKRYPDSIPLVIGSGTLNDLVKRASFEAEREYAVIATAASVDGYASDGAALLYEGIKQTFRCPAPAMIIADMEILATAPEAMTSSGYGDLAGKVPAGADWILAELLGEHPIHQEAWSLVHEKLDYWLSDPRGIFTNIVPLTGLFDGLTQAGLAMQVMKNSRPVSGAEHLISHSWEMEGRTYNEQPISHGHKVALGTVWMMKLYDFLLKNPPVEEDFQQAVNQYETAEERVEKIPALFPYLKDIDFLEKINRQKTLDKKAFTKRLNRVREKWQNIDSALKQYLPDCNAFIAKLKQAQCPVSLVDLDIPQSEIMPTLQRAQYLRDRYTLLDLLNDLGYLKEDKLISIIAD